MPPFPSSQTKFQQTQSLQQRIQAAETPVPVSPSLHRMVIMLGTMKSTDPLQQLQSDIISELYDIVRQLQQASAGPSGFPDVQDVRDAFNKGG